jgi:ferredoxin-NADP reductase
MAILSNPISAVINSIQQEAEGIRSFEFFPADGGFLPSFTAGAHVDIELGNGMVRSYSLVNSQDETHRYVIAVNNDKSGRGGSRYIHEQLKEGGRVLISHPLNNFPLAETEVNSVLIAGGIGITPIWSMVQRLAALGRSWDLHYACRTRSCAAFLAPIYELAGCGSGTASVTFDQEPGGEMLDLSSIIDAAPQGSHFYCCGPKGMLDAFEKATESLPRHLVSKEHFAAVSSAVPVGGDYTLVLARSGKRLKVERGNTILETLLQNGVRKNYSCTQGICGTCETRVLEGIPDHQDWVLSAEKKASNKSIIICCSGSKTDTLVLDI